jgi:CBS domain-containing protein
VCAVPRELDAGLGEIVRFLAARAPFDGLAVEELAEVAAQAAIEFHLRGAVILSEDGGPVTFLRVIHSGGVDIAHEGRLLDLLGPGDTFGHAAMLSGLPPGFEARAAEDTLCYRIPVAVARPLLDQARRRELRAGAAPEGVRPVAELIRSATVTAKPSESIGTVAERMTRAGASAAVVMLAEGEVGILTDRDLRSRVLAVGRNGGVRVDSAMTAPAYVVTPDRLGADVLFEMLERGIRHAPVISERGRLIGVLEDADLFAAQPRSWFGARRAIARARTLDGLAEAAQRLPALMLELHASSVPALELARVLSALVDALCVRSLELVDADRALVYVALGSHARRELTPGSTRRGALIGDTDASGAREIRAALRVCGVSEAIEIATAEGWLERRDAAVLADRRVLWGTPSQPLPTTADARSPIVSELAQAAFAHVPPTGFDADSVLSLAGREPLLDIRAGGGPRSPRGRRRRPTSSGGRPPSGWPQRPPKGCSATIRRRR